MDFKPTVKYNDEYTFDSDYFSMYRTKSDDSVSTWGNFNADSDSISLVKSLGLEIGYFSGTIQPLTSKTFEVRGIIIIPKAIKDDAERKLILNLCGESFIIN